MKYLYDKELNYCGVFFEDDYEDSGEYYESDYYVAYPKIENGKVVEKTQIEKLKDGATLEILDIGAVVSRDDNSIIKVPIPGEMINPKWNIIDMYTGEWVESYDKEELEKIKNNESTKMLHIKKKIADIKELDDMLGTNTDTSELEKEMANLKNKIIKINGMIQYCE